MEGDEMTRPIAESILLVASIVKEHGPCSRARVKTYINESMYRNLNNNLDRAMAHGLIEFTRMNGEKIYSIPSADATPRPLPIAKPGIATFWQPVKPWGGRCPQPDDIDGLHPRPLERQPNRPARYNSPGSSTVD
jgi:hypothetical protein